MVKDGATTALVEVLTAVSIVVLPKSTAVTSPLGETVATLGSDDAQCAVDVISFLDPSDKPPPLITGSSVLAPSARRRL
jgi:hypothetical protein